MAAWITWAPVVIVIAFTAFFIPRSWLPAQDWMLDENHPIELLTFLTLLPAGLIGIWMSMNRKITGGRALLSVCLLIIGLGLLWTALEEVSYGQSFFDYTTPAWFDAHNAQDELNLHNLSGFQNKAGWLRLAFGVGGLIGLWAQRWPRFARVSVPRVLWPWFVTITALAVFDNVIGLHPLGERIDKFNEQINEVTEMMIGFAGLLYVLLCARRARLMQPGSGARAAPH